MTPGPIKDGADKDYEYEDLAVKSTFGSEILTLFYDRPTDQAESSSLLQAAGYSGEGE
jgi:hypothetical protein